MEPKTWEIVEKLDEKASSRFEQDITDGMSPAFVAGKFLCRPSDAEGPLALMRIYQQIPWIGTKWRKASVRAAQAAEPFEPRELLALKNFKERNCKAVPDLLGYQFGKQDEEDIVPGGFVTYVVWEKVPGEPLDFTRFWNSLFSEREEIRAKFRKIYE